MTDQREYWDQLIRQYDEARQKINEYETRVYIDNNLATSDEMRNHQKWLKTRDAILIAMGQEFPNLYARLRVR